VQDQPVLVLAQMAVRWNDTRQRHGRHDKMMARARVVHELSQSLEEGWEERGEYVDGGGFMGRGCG
jgi:hypothetical protein